MKSVERDPRPPEGIQAYEPGTYELTFTLFNFVDTEKRVRIERYFDNTTPSYLRPVDILDGCSSYSIFTAMVEISDDFFIKITEILGKPDIHYLDPDRDIRNIIAPEYKDYHL
jgi:hypothetical protein